MGHLEVPVSLSTVGQSSLLYTGGGTTTVIPFPVNPFKIVEVPKEYTGAERVNLIGGGETYIGKESYPVIPVSSSLGKKSAIHTVDYVLELVKEYPDRLRAMVTGNIDPYPLFLDIETTSTELHFSKAERDQILSIQLKYLDSTSVIFLNESLTQSGEIDMLFQFIDYVKMSPTGKQPDFIVGYFINRFDIPYIKTRIRMLTPRSTRLGIAFEGLSRAPKDPLGRVLPIRYPGWLYSGRHEDEEVDLAPGIVNLDLFVHAKADQTLATLPSKGLKAAGGAYGATVYDLSVEEKRDMAGLLKRDRDKFLKYANGDIDLTEYLYKIYENRLVAAANLLSCPVTMVHRMTSGQKSYIALYRECRKSGYYSLAKNEYRYSHLYAEADKYQGALVACYRKGYFPETVYLDAKSLYPNIMHDFNISYDRYKLLELITYENWEAEKKKFPANVKEQKTLVSSIDILPYITSYGLPDKRIVYIPDDNYHMVFKYEVDFLTDGFIKRMINHYNGVRDQFKKKSKEYLAKFRETNDPAYKIQYMNYDSTQSEAKIINNTFYGIQGNKYYDMADLPAAVFVTAMGRWIMTEMVRAFGKRAIIEIDTDGLLLDKRYVTSSIEDINILVRNKIMEFFGVPVEKMNFLLEFEEEGSVYMYKRKNYILRKNSDPNTLYPKGSSFRGYDKAKVLHRAVRLLSDAVMFKSDDKDAYTRALAEARDIHGIYAREGRAPFKFTKTLKKTMSEYKGYKNAETVIFNINIDTTQPLLKQYKSNAIKWVSIAYSGTDPKVKNRASELRSSIRSCKTEDQLRAVAKHLSSIQSPEDRNKRIYFVTDMVERMQRAGRKVEIDDSIEYYYTMTKEQYSLESEMIDGVKLNFRKYQDDIENIITRFSYADPRRISLSFDDMMEDDDDTEEIDTNVDPESDEEEED